MVMGHCLARANRGTLAAACASRAQETHRQSSRYIMMSTPKDQKSASGTARLAERPAERANKRTGHARLALALSAGKLAGSTGRLLRVGGGTSFPGIVARRIDPAV